MKFNAFYTGKTGQTLLKHVNGHWFTCMIVNSYLLVLIHTKPSSSFFRNVGLSTSYTNSLIPPPTMATANLKLHNNLYFNSDSPLALKTARSHPTSSLPTTPLAAPASITQSLSTVDESHSAGCKLQIFLFSIDSIYSQAVYRHESGRCLSFLPYLTIFLFFICK